MADRYPNRPSFADRSFERGPSPQGGDAQDSDPLAELARLIGQTDPNSNFARGRQTNPPQASRSLATDFSAGPPSWLHGAQSHQLPQIEPTDAGGDPQLTPMPSFLKAPRQPAPADRYDDVLYGQQDQEQDHEQYDDEQQEYADEDYPEDALEGPPAFLQNDARRRRSGGILTVAVVAGLAVVGTAGAYAYRSYSGAPRSGTPPVIAADRAPNKVVPPTQAGDSSGKLIYDRIGSASGPERVVPREEQPVDVNAGGPRPAFPPVGAPSAPPQQVASDDSALDPQPRKIRTVPIHADQPTSAPVVAAKPAPAPTAVRTIPVRSDTPPPTGNAPMSLSPAAAPPSTVRSASAAAPPATPATPTNVARTSGGYLVQIASQKSEAEAQASYRDAQAKYGNLLGSMSPIIKRADLGDKGIYYRAMVGPFSTSDEAGRLCSNLRIAGGTCVVQRN
jgi:hypothetical protein